MKKIDFFILNYSVDPKVTGKLSQLKKYQINDFIDSKNNSLERTNLYQSSPEGFYSDSINTHLFKADKDAKMTDLMSSLFLPKAFFISKKFRNILNEFNLSNIKFFDATVNKNDNRYDYFILNFCESKYIIDFSKSVFFFDKTIPVLRKGSSTTINVSSYEDYWKTFNKLSADKGFGYSLIPEKIVLKEKTDMCVFHFDLSLYISENVKNRIERENLTGTEISKPMDGEFFTE